MKPCWRDLGVTEEGERVCDALIDDLVAWFKKCPPELEASLLTEARFRARELPKRTRDYQRRYEKDNAMGERFDIWAIHPEQGRKIVEENLGREQVQAKLPDWRERHWSTAWRYEARPRQGAR